MVVFSCGWRSLTLQSVLGGRGDAESCEPSCTGIQPGVQIPDPRDCKKYYFCLADNTPSDESFECPGDELFDTISGECLDRDPAACGVCPPVCLYQCPLENAEGAVIPDRNNCSIFHQCQSGTDHPCPDDYPYFDGNNCMNDSSLCCNQCTEEPFCSVPYTEIPDPSNCSNFYFCDHVKYPDQSDLYTCGSGYFDPELGACSDLVTCQQFCWITLICKLDSPFSFHVSVFSK